jgi:hypothetical protein
MPRPASQHNRSATIQPGALIPPENDRRNCQRHRSSWRMVRSRPGVFSIGFDALSRRSSSNLTLSRRVCSRGSSEGVTTITRLEALIGNQQPCARSGGAVRQQVRFLHSLALAVLVGMLVFAQAYIWPLSLLTPR